MNDMNGSQSETELHFEDAEAQPKRRRAMPNQRNLVADGDHIVVEDLVLPDGRRAERHTTIDSNGDEVVEVFAEEKRPVKLEKRIIRKHKDIVAEEIVETVRDGVVAHREVRSLEPKTPLQVVERIGLADHAKVVDGDYIRRDEISKMVADAVVEGVSALVRAEAEYVPAQPYAPQYAPQTQPQVLRAQAEVAQNVDTKKQARDQWITYAIGGVVVLQLLGGAALLVWKSMS